MSSKEPGPRAALVRKIIIDLSIMTVIGLVLAVIGPFGSAEAPFALRLVSWLGLAYLGYVVYSPMGWMVERAHTALHLPRIGLWVGAVLIATVPLAILIWIIGFLPGPIPSPTLPDALGTYLNVLVIGASITAIFYLIESRNAVEDAAPASQPAAQEEADEVGPRFIERLPAHLGSDLIALEMEDHYVRAHTALGSELVLMRLRDAVAELDGIEGEQVHRSWWVARHAVEDVRREGRNIRLVLPNGLEAPVSRNAAPGLRDKGWI
ncbi:LytTR family DNA-binding domain-containing protein [Erythrobacter sp. HKB08]|uniref:LytTR family DNA-binding domain-containing protein n=1 Tax=Erythrobacter sp. HKB08 TaxID=2502843 RepID=UPI001008D5E3|nr:LytTR family DNA-binding domain-containing protein [Erythrobacter sp. HKB08]